MTEAPKDRALIEQLHRDWIAAELEGRTEDIITLCTPTIVIQPPIGPPIIGRDAFKAFLNETDDAIEEIEISDLTLDLCDSLAVKRARFSTVVAGQPVPVRGRHLWILRPSWKVDFVTWSLDDLPGATE